MACQTGGRVSEDESRPAMSIEDLIWAKVGWTSIADLTMPAQDVPSFLKAAKA